MATSGYFQSRIIQLPETGRTRFLVFDWTADNPDIENNRTKVSWSLYANGNESGWVAAGPVRLSINGTLVVNITDRIQLRQWDELASGEFWVNHNEQGAGYFYSEINSYIYYYEAAGSQYASNGNGTFELNTIPRGRSTLTASGGTLGTSQSLTINKAFATYTHTLTYTAGDVSGTIVSGTSDSVINWTPPYNLATAATGRNKVSVTLTLTTFSGGTSLGSNSYTYEWTIPENTNTRPTAQMTYSVVSSLGSAFSGLWIQGKTKASVSFTNTAAKYGATISNGVTVLEAKEYTGLSVTTDFISASGSATITGVVVDSRGIASLPLTQTISVIPYERPRVVPYTGYANVECFRADENGIASPSGTYLHIKAGRSYSKVNSGNTQKNFCILKYRYKNADGDTYSGWETLIARNSISSDVVDINIPGIVTDVQASYNVQLCVEDDIGETSTITITTSSADIPLHLGAGGKSVGIGRRAHTTPGTGRIDTGWPFHAGNGLYIGDISILDYVFPVGSAFLTEDETFSPEDIYGGVWTMTGQYNDFYYWRRDT